MLGVWLSERLAEIDKPVALLPLHVGHQSRCLGFRRARDHFWSGVGPGARNPWSIVLHYHLPRRRCEQLLELLKVDLPVVIGLLQVVDGSADQVLLYFLRRYRLPVVLEDESVDAAGINLLLAAGELLIQEIVFTEVSQLQYCEVDARDRLVAPSLDLVEVKLLQSPGLRSFRDQLTKVRLHRSVRFVNFPDDFSRILVGLIKVTVLLIEFPILLKWRDRHESLIILQRIRCQGFRIE